MVIVNNKTTSCKQCLIKHKWSLSRSVFIKKNNAVYFGLWQCGDTSVRIIALPIVITWRFRFYYTMFKIKFSTNHHISKVISLLVLIITITTNISFIPVCLSTQQNLFIKPSRYFVEGLLDHKY